MSKHKHHPKALPNKRIKSALTYSCLQVGIDLRSVLPLTSLSLNGKIVFTLRHHVSFISYSLISLACSFQTSCSSDNHLCRSFNVKPCFMYSSAIRRSTRRRNRLCIEEIKNEQFSISRRLIPQLIIISSSSSSSPPRPPPLLVLLTNVNRLFDT